MFMCACCGRKVAEPHRRGPRGASGPGGTRKPYRKTARCQYCSGFPYAHDGSCLGMHGAALDHHLDELVANGFWTRELADWWRAHDRRRLSGPAR